MTVLPDTYWAWVAGIVDGEGTFRMSRARPRPPHRPNWCWTPELMVINTDEGMIDRLLWSGLNSNKTGPHLPNNPRHNLRWKWHARAPWMRQALPLVMPYMVTKYPQARAMMDAGCKGSEELAYDLSVLNVGQVRADERVRARLVTS